MNKFFPFLNWIGDVNSKTLKADIYAGLTGAIVVLPQGVAFALIAGLPPIYGLYTAIILPIVAALFGSSRHLISGPTTAISIVIFSTVSQFAVPGTPEYIQIAISITLLTGLIQLALGIARLGSLVNFVSHSVVLGFTAGAAILIGVGQLKYILDITVPSDLSFGESLITIFQKGSELNPYAVIVGISTLIIAVTIKKFIPKIPNMLIAMVFGSLLAIALGGNEIVKTVGTLPSGLPPFEIPIVSLKQYKLWFPNAFAIALLGLIEAVAIARSIATKSGQRIDGNQEFIGQGLSNIVGSFFSSYAGSGSFTRSGVNYSSGAKTPLSAIFAASILALLILFIGPLTAQLPIAVMGGVIMLVAYNLIDFHHIKRIFKTSKRESSVLLITFISTLTLNLEYAIYMGIFFSLIFYLNRTSHPRFVEIAPDNDTKRRIFRNTEKFQYLNTCPQLMIYRIEGSLFFGAVESVSNKLNELFERKEKHLLIIANNINLIDSSGAEFLENEFKRWRDNGKHIYFSGFKLRSREYLQKGKFWHEMGDANFFENKDEAISAIYKTLDNDILRTCKVRIFTECNN